MYILVRVRLSRFLFNLFNLLFYMMSTCVYVCWDLVNGCINLSKKVFEIRVNLDPIFHHAIGDFVYGLREKKKGIELYVAPDFVGICESHDFVPRWRSPEQSVSTRLKSLYLPNSGCYPPQFFIFDNRHNGFFQACLHYFTIHLRAIMPSLWKS